MGFLENMSDLMNNFDDSWYAKIVDQSMISADKTNGNWFQINSIAPVPLLDFMEGYHFLESILKLYHSIILDILSKSSFKSTITDINGVRKIAFETTVDSEIKASKLKSVILRDLKCHLYRGSSGYHYNRTGKKIYKIKDMGNGLVFRQGDVIKFYSPSGLSEKDIVLPPNLITYIQNPYVFNEYTRAEVERNDYLKIFNKSDAPKNAIILEGLKGRGVVNDVMERMYQLALHEFQLHLLIYKEALRQDLLIANINQRGNNRAKIEEAMNDIEAGLSFADIAVSVSSPQVAFQKAVKYFQNSVKVVPSNEAIASLEPFDRLKESDKIERLSSQIERERKQILEDLGIPEELYSGSSNRWEVISRSSRLLSSIQSLLADEISVFKQFAYDTLRREFPTEKISDYNIEFSVSQSNVIINSTMSSQMEVLSQKMRTVADLLESLTRLEGNAAVDHDEYVVWVKNQLEAIDPTSSNFIKVKTKDNKKSIPSRRGLP